MRHAIKLGLVTITFPGKPSAAIRDCLKSYGFRWQSIDKHWWAVESVSSKECVELLLKGAPRVKEQSRGDSFDMAYEDACARACGL